MEGSVLLVLFRSRFVRLAESTFRFNGPTVRAARREVSSSLFRDRKRGSFWFHFISVLFAFSLPLRGALFGVIVLLLFYVCAFAPLDVRIFPSIDFLALSSHAFRDGPKWLWTWSSTRPVRALRQLGLDFAYVELFVSLSSWTAASQASYFSVWFIQVFYLVQSRRSPSEEIRNLLQFFVSHAFLYVLPAGVCRCLCACVCALAIGQVWKDRWTTARKNLQNSFLRGVSPSLAWATTRNPLHQLHLRERACWASDCNLNLKSRSLP